MPGRRSAEEAWRQAALSPGRPSVPDGPELSSDGQWVSDDRPADTDSALSRTRVDWATALPAETFDAGGGESGEDAPEDPDEMAGEVTATPRAIAPGAVRAEVAADLNTGAAEEQAGDSRPDAPASPELIELLADNPLLLVVSGLVRADNELKGVSASCAAALAELLAARADGKAMGLSRQDLGLAMGLPAKLEQIRDQIAALRESALQGSEPSPAETARVGSQLTEARETAVLVGRELPGSKLCRRLVAGIGAALRWTTSVLVMLVHTEVKGISVTLSAGLPFGTGKAEITFELEQPGPEPPGAGIGGAPGS
jgi:hypothetical protein